MSQLTVEAAQALQDATDKALRTEREHQARVRALEASHAETEKNLTAVQRRNRRLATELGGLAIQDVGRVVMRPCPSPPPIPHALLTPSPEPDFQIELQNFFLTDSNEPMPLPSTVASVTSRP